MLTEASSRDYEMRLRAHAVGLHERHVSILHQGIDRHYDLAENIPPAWPTKSLIGKTTAETLPIDLADQLDTAQRVAFATGDGQTIDFEMRGDAGRRLFEARVAPDYDDAGEYAGTTYIITDVTEDHGREMAVNALMREVSHRSKNMLAIVQSVAMQTAHHSGGIDDFLARFQGRLHALSSTQDLVTESNWRGTFLQSLISAQLARIGQTSFEDMRVTGDNPMLGPNAALHIGLAIHELGTNSVLYGALSGRQMGKVWIDAAVSRVDNEPTGMVFQWRESGLHPTTPAAPPRFGTLVLERIVPISVGGTATFELGDTYVAYTLTVPADQFEA